MPVIERDGQKIHYVERGNGTETVVFSHSFLADHRHFEPQIEALESRYRIIAYDHRDHGASDQATTPYALSDLVSDAEAVIEHTRAFPCHFVGLSTGGFVGMRLAVSRPDLLRTLTLMDTAAGTEPWLPRLKYQGLFAALRLLGTAPLSGAAMRLMFGPRFLRDPQWAADRQLWQQRIADNDPKAVIRFGTAIFHRDDWRTQLPDIQCPTLVFMGEHDRVTPPHLGRILADGIPGAQLHVVPDAGHMTSIENSAFVNSHLASFLESA